MSGRPVLLTAAEAEERARMAQECGSAIALEQYLAELIVLRQLLAAARARSLRRIEHTLLRLSRPSLETERALAQASSEAPAAGSERLL